MAFLPAQCASILAQRDVDVRLRRRGSVDQMTLDWLERQAMANTRCVFWQRSFGVPNFLRLLRDVDLHDFDDAVSFADQDDLWPRTS